MKKLLKKSAVIVSSAILFTACGSTASSDTTDTQLQTEAEAALSASKIESIVYDSTTIEEEQRMQVYLPAGYEESEESYPVLYLINGGGTDDTAWTEGGGNMQSIMDELIASEEAVPMIVVMPDGGLNSLSEGAVGTDHEEGDSDNRRDENNEKQDAWNDNQDNNQTVNPELAKASNDKRDTFIEELEVDIIPYIDDNYRTIADAGQRAIAGFSYGGAEALYAGVGHTDLFSWVGVFSMGIQGGSDAGAQSIQGSGSSLTPEEFVEAHEDFFADSDVTNDTLNLFWIAVGEDDQIISNGAEQLSNTLDDYDITYIFKTTSGGHDMNNWQKYLREFAARLFKSEPYADISYDVTDSVDVEEIYNSVIRMDTHLHVDVPMTEEQLPGPDIDLRTAMQETGMNAIGMTFAVDYVPLTEEGQAYDRFLNALTAQDKILADNDIERTLNGQQFMDNLNSGEPIVIQEVEGAHFLEGDVSRLQEAYDRGVRILDLFHDNDADPALGDVYTNEEVYGGLTELGADTIRESERLGILVDLAHASDDTVEMALEVATKPILISHTGLNTQLGDSPMADFMMPRLISPELAKKVADAGGVIGVWPHLANSPAEYAANIKAMVDVVGIDHVTIGTDSKITAEYDENTGTSKEVDTSSNHVWPDVEDSFYHSVITELVALGYSQEDINKICGGNFYRIFNEATK